MDIFILPTEVLKFLFFWDYQSSFARITNDLRLTVDYVPVLKSVWSEPGEMTSLLTESPFEIG